MNADTDTTYRLVILGKSGVVGRTASSPELTKLAPGDIPVRDRDARLGMERTEWIMEGGKMKIYRAILIEAEARPGEWSIGG